MLIKKEWLVGAIKKEIAAQIKKVVTKEYKAILTAKFKEAEDCILALREVACELAEALYNEKNEQAFLPVGRFNPVFNSYVDIDEEDVYGLAQVLVANGVITEAGFDTIINFKEKDQLRIYKANGVKYIVIDEEIDLSVPMFADQIVVPKVLVTMENGNDKCGCNK